MEGFKWFILVIILNRNIKKLKGRNEIVSI